MHEFTEIVSSVGFPMAVCAALMWFVNTTIKELQQTIAKNTEMLERISGMIGGIKDGEKDS